MSSKGLEMPVSGSDKLDLPVLGRRFSEKAEHLPIKKRRFLFRTPSPPHNTSEVTENSSSQEVQPKPVASLTVTSNDNKVHEEKIVKSSDDICGISLGSYGIKSPKSPATVKLEASSMNIPNISGKETGLHISKVDNSTSDNQVTSQGHKSAVCDERLNWDLNTVMPWEESESPELDHNNIHTMFSEGKKGNPKVCKQEQVCGNPPEIISNQTITNLRIFPHGQKPEEHKKPISNHHINKLLFPVMSTSTSTSTSPPSSHVTVKSEYPHPPCDISSKNSSNFPFSMPAGIGLSLGYDHMRPSEENVGLSKSTANNHAITCTQTTEDENLNLSLVTVSSLEKQVQQTGTNYEEDDKTKVKNVITEEDAYKPINESVTGSLEGEDQPSAVTDAQVVIKTEKSPPLTPPSVTYTKEVGQFENLPSDIQGSEVDNAEEFSVGYDSQFEDGEVRWEGEGSEGDNRENEHDTDNNNNNNNRGIRITTDECALESSSRIKSTDIDSQKATDEISISSVLLPEKPDTSEHVSNSQPNQTDTQEISMKDESESNQWKMNVSGSDDYSNVTKIKDLTSVKLYKRDPSSRDEFINRGSRFRIQSYSSTNGGDDTGTRSLRPFRRGKYSPHVRTSNRGGATWNRDPPFFRDPDNLTTEVNDDVIRPGPPYPTRTQSFRTRPVSDREEDDFRARLGLRPAGDTRFVRPLRYGSAGRYAGPADGGYNEPLDYPHSFQRRDNHPCLHHLSGSTSPPRSRTRSRSPRIRRPRSPGYRFEPDGYNHNNNNNNNNNINNNSNSPRWVKYKQHSSGFHRSPPPIGERLSFYNDSSRKTNYRGGRYSDGVIEHGYRRGGFVKRHEMGRPVKHMEYDEEDGCGVEFGNGKPYNSNNNGSESRFSRRGNGSREER